jgi:hypothetical protein
MGRSHLLIIYSRVLLISQQDFESRDQLRMVHTDSTLTSAIDAS